MTLTLPGEYLHLFLWVAVAALSWTVVSRLTSKLCSKLGFVVLLSLLVLPACDGFPWPFPTPSPSPTATPGPTPTPPTRGYDCDNPAAFEGVHGVDEPWGEDNDEAEWFVHRRARGVQAKARASVEGRAAEAQALKVLSARLAREHGNKLRVLKEHPLVGAFSAKMNGETARRLLADPDVQAVERVGTKRVPPRPSATPSAVKSWGLDRIDQRALPLDNTFAPGGTGAGVTFASLDTGVDKNVADIKSRIVGACFDAFGGNCADDHDHGTHTTVTAVGTEYGVAKEARIIYARVLRNGTGSDRNVLDGINWIVDYCQSNGLKCVINSSLGGGASLTIDRGVCAAVQAGVMFVAAAGNDSSDACNDSPARVVQALTVAASDRTDRAASFSNRDECVDVYAPGAAVVSLGRGGVVLTWDGTSMACPHVAGVALLAWQRHLDWTVAQIHKWVVDFATRDVIAAPANTTRSLVYAKES